MPGRDLAHYGVSKLVCKGEVDVHGVQASQFTQRA